MSEARETLLHYRIERARDTLVEADLMAEAGHWNACVNRLYYVCFYAVTALLLKHGLCLLIQQHQMQFSRAVHSHSELQLNVSSTAGASHK